MRSKQPRRMNSILQGLAESDPLRDAVETATAETGNVYYDAAESESYRYYDANPSGYGASNSELDYAIRSGQAGSGMTPQELHRTVTSAEVLATAQVVDKLPPPSFNAADLGKIIKLGAQVYQMREMRNAQGQMVYAPVPVNTSQISPVMLAALAAAAFLILS